jgi:anti-sigma factor RsiW
VPASGCINGWVAAGTGGHNLNCRETQALIHGYVDGELDLMKSLEIEQHLQECPACAQAHTSLQAVRTAIRHSSLYFQTPPGLARRVQSSVRRAGHADRTPRVRPLRLIAVAASLALIIAAGWGLVRVLPARSADEPLTQELVASHVRSQMLPSHRFDVASSDPHTVKPWFEGKLDFSPPVKDLAGQGFPLVGGRLDYLHNRPVAALVYQRRKHSINLFIWPSAHGSEASTGTGTRQGYHLIRWTQSGMTHWAVSDLNNRELQEFVRMLQD